MRPIVSRIVRLGAVLALGGCMGAQAGSRDAAEPLAGTAWRLEELNGRPAVAVPGGGTPTLTFETGEPRAGGNGGCNHFGGPYTQEGESLRFGPLVSTRRACVDEAANSQETAYLRALESTTRYSVSGDQLVLYAGDQVVARLRRSGG